MKKTTGQTLRPYMTPAAAWAFALGTSIGWGSLVVTSNTYLAQAGPLGSVLGMLAGMVVMLIISRSYAYLVQCLPEAGGAYTYAREVFGYDYGFLTAWFLALTYFSMLWANATSLPLFARIFFGPVFQVGRMYTLFGYNVYLGEALLSIAAILVIAFLCTWNKRIVALLMLGMVVLFSAGILIVFAGVLLGRDSSMLPAYVPDTKALSQVVRIAVISPWAFIGFENISHAAEEYSFKRTRIFRVLVVSVLTTTVLYICVTLLSVTAYPPEYASWLEYIRDLDALRGIRALPAFYAAQHYLGSFGVFLLAACLLALVITSLIGNITALSRLLLAMARDKILPEGFAQLNRRGVPGNAIWLIAGLSACVPFLGRTAIGWIVDVTTIGATIIYGLVCAAAIKLGDGRRDWAEKRTAIAGLAAMIVFAGFLLVPNLVSEGSMARETYFLFIVWSMLGFLFFRFILHRDRERRFGKSVVVWVALLALVLLVALIWMRQSMIASNNRMLSNIQAHYSKTFDLTGVRAADEQFIRGEMQALEAADTRTILMATAMFAFALLIMITNYSYMLRRTKESEQIANTDPLTGVKSKHAWLTMERGMNESLRGGAAEPFAVVVCDVNGLKFINDTYGHKEGDNLIREACRLICRLFQHSPVYRIGGDEFVVLLRGEDYEARAALMEQVRIQSEANIGTEKLVLAAGLADFDARTDTTFRTVFDRADSSMYESKQRLRALGARTR